MANDMMGPPNPPERVYFLGPEKPKEVANADPNGTFNGFGNVTKYGTANWRLAPGRQIKWPSNQGNQ